MIVTQDLGNNSILTQSSPGDLAVAEGQRDGTVGVTEKLPLPFCNYCSNGGKTVNSVLFAACRSNVERTRHLNVLH